MQVQSVRINGGMVTRRPQLRRTPCDSDLNRQNETFIWSRLNKTPPTFRECNSPDVHWIISVHIISVRSTSTFGRYTGTVQQTNTYICCISYFLFIYRSYNYYYRIVNVFCMSSTTSHVFTAMPTTRRGATEQNERNELSWTANCQSVCLRQKSAFLENVVTVTLFQLWIHDLEMSSVSQTWKLVTLVGFINIYPRIPEIGGKMPPKVLSWPRCDFDLLTSTSTQFTFVANCIKYVNLMRCPQAVYKKSR